MKKRATDPLRHAIDYARTVLDGVNNGVASRTVSNKSIAAAFDFLKPFASPQKRGGDVQAAYYLGILSMRLGVRQFASDGEAFLSDARGRVAQAHFKNAEKYLGQTIKWPDAPKDIIHYDAMYILSNVYEVQGLLGDPIRSEEIWTLREKAAAGGCLDAKISIAEGSLTGLEIPFSPQRARTLIEEVEERKAELSTPMCSLLAQIKADLDNVVVSDRSVKKMGFVFNAPAMGWGNC